MISEYLELIRQDAILAEGKETIGVQLKDVDDIEIIASAISGKADVLVTGDSELQGIRRVRHLRILSPRAFWEELTAKCATQPD